MKRISRVLLTVSVLVALASFPAAAGTLTGAGLWGTDSSGSGPGSAYWNTVTSDVYADIFLSGGGFGVAFPAGPGTYTYAINSTAAGASTFYGLNLFFDGTTGTPGISALISPLGPDGAALTPSLPRFPQVAGANTLSFVDGTQTIVLTALTVASGVNGLTGSMTLTVRDSAAIPEPSVAALTLLGLTSLVLYRRRKRT
jgi:hypothetical protein